ncbi:hypothetical protein [Rhodococcus rhodochrous]|uniref:hypothetical protein n=1 Tax=Rhodococcus rhodochrous TaxID=1829 RepID=UPI000A8AFFD8|nr:hypothetical protein [Rhodococcus rhodochrous]
MTGRSPRRPPRRVGAEISAPAIGIDEFEVLLRRALRRARGEGYHASNVDPCFNAAFGTDRRSVNPYDRLTDAPDQHDAG